MKSKKTEPLLHMDYKEPDLVYRYSPTRSLVVLIVFLAICVVTALAMLPRAREVTLVLGIFSAVLLFQLLKTCYVRILLDWPNLIYSYRSVFKKIDETIPSWEISDISPEITSMWRGNISERLVLEAGKRKFVITPFYSSSNPGIIRLMDIIHSLPSTRKQALYEIELQRRVAEGENGKAEDDESSEITVWGMIEMSIECPRCSSPVVINGPVTSLVCSICAESIEMTHEIWADLLEDVRDEIADDLEVGMGGRSKIWGTYNTNLYYGRLHPYCSGCKHDFDFEKEYTGGRFIICPECGKQTAVIAAPAWFDMIFEGAVYIAGAELEGESSESDRDKRVSPVAFTCSQCGASIRVNGSKRTFKCEHCDAPIYLPDDLWNHLHPAPKKKRWFIGFKVEVIEDDE